MDPGSIISPDICCVRGYDNNVDAVKSLICREFAGSCCFNNTVVLPSNAEQYLRIVCNKCTSSDERPYTMNDVCEYLVNEDIQNIHAMRERKCLEVPINVDAISSTFGFNGSTTFICAICSRRINMCKDSVISHSALTNCILNATNASEKKIRKLEVDLTRMRADWTRERTELMEERDRLLRQETKRRDRHRNRVDRSVVLKIEHMYAKLLHDIRKFVGQVLKNNIVDSFMQKDRSSSSSSSNRRPVTTKMIVMVVTMIIKMRNVWLQHLPPSKQTVLATALASLRIRMLHSYQILVAMNPLARQIAETT